MQCGKTDTVGRKDRCCKCMELRAFSYIIDFLLITKESYIFVSLEKKSTRGDSVSAKLFLIRKQCFGGKLCKQSLMDQLLWLE